MRVCKAHTHRVQPLWEEGCKLQCEFAEGIKTERQAPPNKAREGFREGLGKKDAKNSQ